jgi:hypothetical protein
VGLLLVALAIGAAAPGTAPAASPALRAVSMTPLKLQGVRFELNERVVVTLSVAARTWTRRAGAGRAGTFAVNFGLIALDPCPGNLLVARATGSSGSRASYKRPCRPPHRHPS